MLALGIHFSLPIPEGEKGNNKLLAELANLHDSYTVRQLSRGRNYPRRRAVGGRGNAYSWNVFCFFRLYLSFPPCRTVVPSLKAENLEIICVQFFFFFTHSNFPTKWDICLRKERFAMVAKATIIVKSRKGGCERVKKKSTGLTDEIRFGWNIIVSCHTSAVFPFYFRFSLSLFLCLSSLCLSYITPFLWFYILSPDFLVLFMLHHEN